MHNTVKLYTLQLMHSKSVYLIIIVSSSRDSNDDCWDNAYKCQYDCKHQYPDSDSNAYHIEPLCIAS